MTQIVTRRTTAQQEAYKRDGGFCVWCYQKRDIRIYATDVHHILGRKPGADIPEACISLCPHCHRDEAHNAGHPNKAELIELMKEVYGIDLWAILPEYAS